MTTPTVNRRYDIVAALISRGIYRPSTTATTTAHRGCDDAGGGRGQIDFVASGQSDDSTTAENEEVTMSTGGGDIHGSVSVDGASNATHGHMISGVDILARHITERTPGFCAADLVSVCQDAAVGAVREHDRATFSPEHRTWFHPLV